jgi:hypothetical protein
VSGAGVMDPPSPDDDKTFEELVADFRSASTIPFEITSHELFVKSPPFYFDLDLLVAVDSDPADFAVFISTEGAAVRSPLSADVVIEALLARSKAIDAESY